MSVHRDVQYSLEPTGPALWGEKFRVDIKDGTYVKLKIDNIADSILCKSNSLTESDALGLKSIVVVRNSLR